MQVWVIMGNDYPTAVCSTVEKADAAIEFFKKKSRESPLFSGLQTIYWRHYNFELDNLES